ncbi:MAG: glycosyl hydrolase, partial [Phaeodactylibacter sp.]|nr:glycosyl hydrolase [Phaeodactylibacter sp.]
REVRQQLKHFTSHWEGDDSKKELIARANAIDSVMTVVEKALYQTQNQSNQDPLNFPIRLTNKLAHLNSLARMGDFQPTDAELAVKEELVQAIDQQLAVFYGLKEKEIPDFNQDVKEQAVDVIILKTEE